MCLHVSPGTIRKLKHSKLDFILKAESSSAYRKLYTEKPLGVHMAVSVQMMLLAAAAAAKSLQSCPTLCDPIDGSPPDSPVPGILQARGLEGVAIAFSGS